MDCNQHICSTQSSFYSTPCWAKVTVSGLSSPPTPPLFFYPVHLYCCRPGIETMWQRKTCRQWVSSFLIELHINIDCAIHFDSKSNYEKACLQSLPSLPRTASGNISLKITCWCAVRTSSLGTEFRAAPFPLHWENLSCVHLSSLCLLRTRQR